MKKIILSCLVFISLSHFSQNLNNFRFGLTGSLNYSGIRGVHNPSEQKYGFNFGLAGLLELGSSQQFYFQPQVEYVNAGEKGENKTQYTNNYINIPLTLKAFFSESESEFFGILGPRIGFLVSQSVIDESEERYKLDKQGKGNPIDIAIIGGMGYSFKRKHELSIKLDLGFSDVYKNLDDSGIDPNSAANNTQNIISLGYTYFFD